MATESLVVIPLELVAPIEGFAFRQMQMAVPDQAKPLASRKMLLVLADDDIPPVSRQMQLAVPHEVILPLPQVLSKWAFRQLNRLGAHVNLS